MFNSRGKGFTSIGCHQGFSLRPHLFGGNMGLGLFMLDALLLEVLGLGDSNIPTLWLLLYVQGQADEHVCFDFCQLQRVRNPVPVFASRLLG